MRLNCRAHLFAWPVAGVSTAQMAQFAAGRFLRELEEGHSAQWLRRGGGRTRRTDVLVFVLHGAAGQQRAGFGASRKIRAGSDGPGDWKIGRASCRERV